MTRMKKLSLCKSSQEAGSNARNNMNKKMITIYKMHKYSTIIVSNCCVGNEHKVSMAKYLLKPEMYRVI